MIFTRPGDTSARNFFRSGGGVVHTLVITVNSESPSKGTYLRAFLHQYTKDQISDWASIVSPSRPRVPCNLECQPSFRCGSCAYLRSGGLRQSLPVWRSVLVHQHIIRLDIAVDDVEPMGADQCVTHVQGNLGGAFDRKWSRLDQLI